MAKQKQTSTSRQKNTASNSILPGRLIFLIPPAYYVLHVLEELPGFAAWSSRHFSPTPQATYAAFEIISLLLVFLIAYKAFVRGSHGAWVVLAVAAQFQFAFNALFHITSGIVFKEYSPGMVIGATLGIPLTIYFMNRVWSERRVSGREMILALGLGTAIAAAAIGLLFI